ncbi:MAG: YdeI/OmpD-associated family protein [Halofilum sp. (in: g-proteobacteria)]
MPNKAISPGVVHSVPDDLRAVLVDDEIAVERWEDITPLARNEWICWVEDAKKRETRRHRIERLRSELKEGKRRPCCWPGCPHREKNGRPQ